MGSFIIFLTTVIALMTLIVRSVKNNRKIKSTIGRVIKDINKTYVELFTERSFLVRITQGGMILLAEVFMFISILTTIIRYLDTYLPLSIDLGVRIICILISFVIVHYSIGYVLLVSSKIHRFIYRVEDKNLKVDFILSYFITSTFLAVLLLFPKEFSENAIVGLLGILICYYLNFKVLLTLMVNPRNIKSNKETETSFRRVMVAAILILT